MKISDILTMRGNYHDLMSPLLARPALSDVIAFERIDLKLTAVQTLRERARAAKARNKFDEEWENGIKCLLEAFECLEDLERRLAGGLSRGAAEKAAMDSRWYGKHSLILALVGIGAGLAIGMLF